MQTLDQCLQNLVRGSTVAASEARSKAVNKELFPGN
jgi:twitching motility protein PilT